MTGTVKAGMRAPELGFSMVDFKNLKKIIEVVGGDEQCGKWGEEKPEWWRGHLCTADNCIAPIKC